MDTQFTKPTRVRINPSRATCEEIIRRILNAEIQENGSNIHFKNAMDFMTYFESLYPSGSALTKQVQRAIKAMDLAKDENGFFLIDRTKTQVNEEKELREILKKTNASIADSTSYTCVFLAADTSYRSYLKELLSEAAYLRKFYTTIIDSSDGLIFLSLDPDPLKKELSRLLK